MIERVEIKCPYCDGEGRKKIPGLGWVECAVCEGERLSRESLSDLPETSKESVEGILQQMAGCLRDYAYKEGNISETIRSVREGE